MPRTTAREKVNRDSQLVIDRAKGFTWATISARHGVSERHARDIWNEHLGSVTVEPADTEQAVREALAQIDQGIEDLAALAETTNNDPVRLGAIKARMELLDQRHDLLRLTGRLPFTRRDAWNELEVRRLIDEIIGVFTRHAVSNEATDDLLALLERAA